MLNNLLFNEWIAIVPFICIRPTEVESDDNGGNVEAYLTLILTSPPSDSRIPFQFKIIAPNIKGLRRNSERYIKILNNAQT